MDPVSPHNELKAEVLKRISTEKICPRSRLFFRSRECFVWSLWFITVLVGAVAVAIVLFSVSSHRLAVYEVTHDTFGAFVMEAIPFLWLSVFGVMVFAAIYNLRHTRGGYRYPLWQIFGSSVVFSLVFGSIFHVAGVGSMIDHQLGNRVVFYSSETKREQRLWQQPERGRLVGSFMLPGQGDEQNNLFFTDITNRVWVLNTVELHTDDVNFLARGQVVRLFGEIITVEPAHFYVCGVLPVMPENGVFTEAELRHQRAVKERFLGYSQLALHTTNGHNSRCHNLVMMKRAQQGN